MNIRMSDSEEEIYLGLYTNEAALAIELILDIMQPRTFDNGYERTLDNHDWSIRSDIGEVILIPGDYSGREWYLNYLKRIFDSFIETMNKVVDREASKKMFIKEAQDLGRKYDVSAFEVAEVICKEAFLDADQQSDRFKQIAGEPFQPFKAAALKNVLDELWNHLYRPSEEEKSICAELKKQAKDIIYDRTSF